MQLLSSENPLLYGTDYIRFSPNTYYKSQLNLILSQLERVIGRLEHKFPNAEIIFSSVFERDYWDPLTVHMAKTINWYMKSERKLRLINLNGKVPLEYFRDDMIHYNNLGYHVFMDKGIGMVLELFYGHRRCHDLN